MNRVRLLLVDDHTLLREGLRRLLADQPDLEVVGEAGDGLTAVQQATQLKPHLVLLDIAMPKLDGVEATRLLRKACPEVRVLALTAQASAELLNQMRQAGAVGYVLKTYRFSQLLVAIRLVARGGVWFDPGLMVQAVNKFLGQLAPTNRFPAKDLSNRETQVLHLLAQGHSAKTAAARLGIGPKSVETYKARLMLKLGLTTQEELVLYAITHCLMDES